MEEVALSLTELEIRHRERMKKEGGAKLKDRCLRAYGTLLNCAVLPWEEYSEKILDVRLGIALDYFETTDSVSLVNFLYNMRPLSFRRGNRVTGGEEECNIRARGDSGKGAAGAGCPRFVRKAGLTGYKAARRVSLLLRGGR